MAEKLDESYEREPCKGCGREMAWARMPSGARNPLDPESIWDGSVILDGPGEAHVGRKREIEEHTGPRFVSHWATCPNPPYGKGPRR
jgi:hypothetical protein